MNYLNEIPEKKVIQITECEDLAELKAMRIRHPGAKNVFIRLAIDERMENLKYKMK